MTYHGAFHKEHTGREANAGRLSPLIFGSVDYAMTAARFHSLCGFGMIPEVSSLSLINIECVFYHRSFNLAQRETIGLHRRNNRRINVNCAAGAIHQIVLVGQAMKHYLPSERS